MQELLEKRAKNREKQRIWREKNLEKSRQMKKLSNWKVRGGPPKPKEPVFIPTPEYIAKTTEVIYPPIDVSLCMNCYKKYLTKLYCLWCNGPNYGTR